jgi:cyclic pyranopterin phosphate synthase
LPVTVRFIEYFPTGKYASEVSDYIPNRNVRAIIERKYGHLSDFVGKYNHGPALTFKIKDSAGAIGFISGRSSTFCSSCSRLRLTSDGKIMPCLYSSRTYDLKKLVRSGASDEAILDLLQKVIREKGSYTKTNSLNDYFSMCEVGG